MNNKTQLPSLIGHNKQKNYLLEAFRKRKLAYSWVFSGPSGVGKKIFSLKLAQILNCPHKTPDSEACKTCPSCQQIAHESHENLLIIKPETLNTKISDVKDMLRFLHISPSYGAKVVIFDEADTLNHNASNLILKTLEEPPSYAYFFLLTENPMRLLPTILSRTQKLHFCSLNEDEMKGFLKTYEPWVVKSSQGRPGLLNWLEEKKDLREGAFEAWSQTFQDDEALDFFLSQDKKQTLLIVRFWLEFVRDLFQETNRIHEDLFKIHFMQTEDDFDDKFLALWSERLLDLEKDLKTSADLNLSVESYFYQIRRDFSDSKERR